MKIRYEEDGGIGFREIMWGLRDHEILRVKM